MGSKKSKILFAAVDVGYRIENYTKFINSRYSDKLIPESLTVYAVPSEHYKTSFTYQYDFQNKNIFYKRTRALINFITCLFKYNTFHFISGETLLPRKLRRFELSTYKFFKKNVIMHFVGSDIRDEAYIKWKTKNISEFLVGKDNPVKSQPWQIKLIEHAEKYASTILVSTPDLRKLIPKAKYYPVLLDFDKFVQEMNEVPEPIKSTNTITILHSPSSTLNNLKGSEYIYPILEKIKAASAINIELIFPASVEKSRPTGYPATRYEMFELYKKADIIIDQMIIGWYGLLAIEGLAAGKKVISYVDKDLESDLFENTPILLANVNTFETCILKCIDDLVKGNQSGSKQIEWVKKYHTIEKNNEVLLKAWKI